MSFTIIAIKSFISSINIPLFGGTIDPISIGATIAMAIIIQYKTGIEINKTIASLFPCALLLGLIGFNINAMVLAFFGLAFLITAYMNEGFGGVVAPTK